jgi:hypothetical protein
MQNLLLQHIVILSFPPFEKRREGIFKFSDFQALRERGFAKSQALFLLNEKSSTSFFLWFQSPDCSTLDRSLSHYSFFVILTECGQYLFTEEIAW